MKAKDYTTNALMAVAASKILEDKQNVVVGLGLPQVATQLAQHTHAPNINIIYEIGVINPQAEDTGVGIADPRLWYGAEYFHGFMGTLGEVLQKGNVDVGFLGGLQVDKYGNLNSTHVNLENGGIRHFTGSGGAADIASYSKNIMVIMKHQKRKIVDTVDYITSVGYLEGYDSREEAGLPPCKKMNIITNMCVFKFDEESKMLKIDTIHPGITPEEVIENTGCGVIIPDDLKVTDEPTVEEIELLNTKIDPDGLYI